MAMGADDVTKLRQEHATVAGIALAAALSVAVGEGPWDFWSSMVGVMLLIILLAFVSPSPM